MDVSGFIVRRGKLTRPESIIDFVLPEKLEDGHHTIDVIFKSDEFLRAVNVEFQVAVRKVPRILLSKCPDTFKPGETYDFECTVENATAEHMFLDMKTYSGITRYMATVTDNKVTHSLTMPFQLSPVTIGFSFIDGDGALISISKLVYPDTAGLQHDISFDRDAYQPGDEITISINISRDDGQPVEDAWISINIVDKYVDEMRRHDNATSWFRNIMGYLSSTYSFYTTTNWNVDMYMPRIDLRMTGTIYRYLPVLSLPKSTKETTFDYSARGGWKIDDWGDDDEIIKNYTGEFADDGVANKMGLRDNDEEGGGVFSTDPSQSLGAGSSIQTSVPQSAEELSGDLANILETTAIREDGNDVAFFGNGKSTKNGSASWTFTLPSAIATWKVEATGHTKELNGAYVEREFVVKRDFYVEVDMPVRICQDDELTFTVNVFNFLGRPVDVEVGIIGDWLLVFDGNQKELTVDARDVGSVSYDVKITGTLEQNLTVAAAESTGLADALKVYVNIVPNGALKTEHITGCVEDSVAHTVRFLPEHLEGSEKAVLRVAAGYEGLLDFYSNLFSYTSYSSNEAVASSLYKYCFSWEYLEIRTTSDYWKYRLTITINEVLRIMEENQRVSGAWGWWDDDPDDLWITAYCLGALGKAKEIGFTRNQMTVKAVDWVIQEVNPDGSFKGADWLQDEDEAMTAFVYYCLSTISPSDIPTKTATFLADAFDNGMLNDAYSVTMYALGKQEQGRDVSSYLSWLDDHKIGSHWESANSLGGSDETTAWVAYLFALNEHNKADIRGALEWLDMHRGSAKSFGSVTDTIAALHVIIELFKQNPVTSVTVHVSIDGTTRKSFYFSSTTHQYSRDKYTGICTFDLLDFIKEAGSEVVITISGTGDVFYEITTIQYLRVNVSVDYDEEVVIGSYSLFDWNVTLDPDDSDNVWIEDVWIEFPYVTGLNLISYNHKKPDDISDSHAFRFTFMAQTVGKHQLEPLVVNYYLSAGERRSYLIRNYFGPVFFNVTRNETAESLASHEVSIDKTTNKDVYLTNTEILIRLDIALPFEFLGSNITLVDNIPFGFKVISSPGGMVEAGRIEWKMNTIDSTFKIEYTLKAEENFRGGIGRCVLLVEDAVCGISDSPSIRISSKGFILQRSYLNAPVNRNETLWVNLILHALSGGLEKPVVEDYLPAGFEIVGNTFPEVEGIGNAIADPVSPEKVVFSLENLDEGNSISFQYGIRSTIPGFFSSPSALAYPLRDVSNVTYTPPGSVRVLKTWLNSTEDTRNADAEERSSQQVNGYIDNAPVEEERTRGANTDITVYPILELVEDTSVGRSIRGIIENNEDSDIMVRAVFKYEGGEKIYNIIAPGNSVQTVLSPLPVDGIVSLHITDENGNILDSSDEGLFNVAEGPKPELASEIEVKESLMSGRMVVEVIAVISNTGDAVVTSKVLFLMDGKVFYKSSIKVPPGITKEISAFTLATGGEHQYTVIVDPFNDFNEENELDNMAIKTSEFSILFAKGSFVRDPYFFLILAMIVVSGVLVARKNVRKWMMK